MSGAGAAASELVDVVDPDGRVLEVVTRAEMRRRRLRHRTVFVAVVDPDDRRLLVHRRADWKDTAPGWWDIAFGGVVAAGEGWDDAAVRELEEEAGVRAPLEPLGAAAYEDDAVKEVCRVYRARDRGSVHVRRRRGDRGRVGGPRRRARVARRAPGVPGQRRGGAAAPRTSGMSAVAAVLLAVTVGCAVANWIAVASEPERTALVYVAKPATMIALIGVAIALDPFDPAVRAWFVAALVLCLAGDVFLMLPQDLFVAGLASFLLGHLCYVGGLVVAHRSWAATALGVVLVGLTLAASRPGSSVPFVARTRRSWCRSSRTSR